VIGAIEFHPGVSRLDYPFDPLQPLGGRPLLARTVEAALRCPRIEALAVLAPATAARAVEAALKGVDATVLGRSGSPSEGGGGRRAGGAARRWSVIPCDGEDIACRARIRRLRRLAPSSWRAGWAIPFAVAEDGNPRWLLQALDRHRSERLMAFPQSAPFLDPTLIAEMVEEAERHSAAAARLSTAPPGVAGDVLARSLLADCARAGAPADLPLRFLPDRPDRALENKGYFHWFQAEVSGFGTRLSAESRRGMELLRRLDTALPSDGETSPAAGAAAASGRRLARLRERPDLLAGPVPSELFVWATTRERGRSFLDPALGPAGPAEPPLDIDPALFADLCTELGGWQECRLILGGGEPLLHPRLGQLLQAARDSKVGVVEVKTGGRALDGGALDLLLAGADLVSVAVDATREETYRALRSGGTLAEVEEGVGRLLERAAAQGGWPLVAVEMRVVEENREEVEEFFDRWFPRTPLVVVRGASDRAGQLPARAIHPARTPERIPCLHLTESLCLLPDGRAAACENDFRGLLGVGDLRQGVAAVWEGEAMSRLRDLHARGGWEQVPLCRGCGDWCRR
jgi:hypothetical protein